MPKELFTVERQTDLTQEIEDLGDRVTDLEEGGGGGGGGGTTEITADATLNPGAYWIKASTGNKNVTLSTSAPVGSVWTFDLAYQGAGNVTLAVLVPTAGDTINGSSDGFATVATGFENRMVRCWKASSNTYFLVSK